MPLPACSAVHESKQPSPAKMAGRVRTRPNAPCRSPRSTTMGGQQPAHSCRSHRAFGAPNWSLNGPPPEALSAWPYKTRPSAGRAARGPLRAAVQNATLGRSSRPRPSPRSRTKRDPRPVEPPEALPAQPYKTRPSAGRAARGPLRAAVQNATLGRSSRPRVVLPLSVPLRVIPTLLSPSTGITSQREDRHTGSHS